MGSKTELWQLLVPAGFLLVFTLIAGWLLWGPDQRDVDVDHPSPHSLASDTRIEIDARSGVITFLVQGEPVALLDHNGLHVVKDVTYGGLSIDAGQDHVRSYLRNATSIPTGEQSE